MSGVVYKKQLTSTHLHTTFTHIYLCSSALQLTDPLHPHFPPFLSPPHTDAGPLACTSCPQHFMLEAGLCMECLGSQFYDAPTLQCRTCHESCRSCSGPGRYSCVQCAYPLHLDRLNNQCVPCCAAGAAMPEDQSCCHCDKAAGECSNALSKGLTCCMTFACVCFSFNRLQGTRMFRPLTMMMK